MYIVIVIQSVISADEMRLGWYVVHSYNFQPRIMRSPRTIEQNYIKKIAA